MASKAITSDDLREFRQELIGEIKKMLSERQPSTLISKWLKSHQVLRILTISPGTLQRLRDEGTLPFSKIGNVLYYEAQDVENMLQQHKQNTKQHHRKPLLQKA